MHWIDWAVMLGTLVSIGVYGMYRTRGISSSQEYMQGQRDLPWWTIGLSIMATQASAITFMSTPGQAYDDGMRFAQFYFGLPVAMILLSIFVLPLYYRLNVYTAYEYLEQRFDVRVRTFTAILFLLSRGLAAGLTIYAPSIILSSIMGWSLTTTNLLMALLVIVYTFSGGTKAVSVTQKQQMVVILVGMVIAAMVIVWQLPDHVGLQESMHIAGKLGKLEIVNFEFDLSDRYNFWSGMLGGVFLFLSYFGTDQSQVSRYLGGKSLTESRLGLLFNGIVKVPMQFLILFVGILVYVFYLYNPAPLHFNRTNTEQVIRSERAREWKDLETAHLDLAQSRQQAADELLLALDKGDDGLIQDSETRLRGLEQQDRDQREKAQALILEADPQADTNDRDYVFVSFFTEHMPIGLIGLLLAVIFAAAMSSISSELNALSTTTVVDIYRRSFVKDRSDAHYLRASRGFTILWGVIALLFAETASLFENLIQAVNIVGSLFYGTILGIFLTAFFLKRVKARSVFAAALLGEALVVTVFLLEQQGVVQIAFLWLNLIGCVAVMALAWLFSQLGKQEPVVD